jgi:uncharacterized RDD family membrane protein YckC
MTAITHTAMPDPVSGAAATTMPTFYAGFWRRLMAAAIDGVLMLALVVGISVAAGATVRHVNGNVMITQNGSTIPLSTIAKPHVVITRDGPRTTTVETTTTTVGLQTIHSVVTRTTVEQKGGAQSRVSTSANLSMVPSPLALAALFALWLLYTSILEGSPLRATVGKLAMFIRVADEEGHRVTLLRALARNALKLISAAPLCIGYLMAGWTAKKQALHDILARCTVEVVRG